jgi:dynein intermediate chain
MGHTHPVYAMSIVGTKNAHNLVSVSTDGKLCVWSLDNLLQPVEVLELHNKQSKPVAAATAAPVAVTAMAFPEQEVNKFFIGTEEGAVYQAFRHGRCAPVLCSCLFACLWDISLIDCSFFVCFV